jgi:predicted Rossmann-fold nucleotide-binding protein
MEVLTWNQLGLLNTPLFFLNTESFWQPLFHLLHHTDNEGFVHSRKVGTLHQHENAHDLAEIIENILPPRR